MSILLTILYIIGGMVALFLLIAAFTKKDFRVERSTVINRDRREVYQYASLLKNQEAYNVWMMRDPNVRITYTGVDGSVGAMAAWDSNHKHVGAGEQQIIGLKDGEQIDMEMRFKRPFEDTNYTSMVVSDAGNGQSRITSSFFGRNEFPRNLMNLVMDKMLGKDMEKNLANLKNNLEK